MAWPVALVLMMVPLAACDRIVAAAWRAKASNEWTRTYGLNPGGEFQIVGATGSITVKGSETPSIAVKAERIVKAASDSMAQRWSQRCASWKTWRLTRSCCGTKALEGIVLGVGSRSTSMSRCRSARVCACIRTTGM